jgi:hypothetical protein
VALVLGAVAAAAAGACSGDGGDGGAGDGTTTTLDAGVRIVLPSAGLDTGLGGDVAKVAGSAELCAPGVSVVVGGASFAGLADALEGDRVEVTTPTATCAYDVVQAALVAEDDFDPSTAGVGREGALLLATPGPEDGVRRVVVAALDVASTTTTAAPTTTTEPVPVVPQPTGRDAVDSLLGAWRAGDRAAALAVADAAAVDALFAVPPGPTEDRGCTQPGANPSVQCVFRTPAGELQIRAVPREGGFLVDQVILSPAG